MLSIKTLIAVAKGIALAAVVVEASLQIYHLLKTKPKPPQDGSHLPHSQRKMTGVYGAPFSTIRPAPPGVTLKSPPPTETTPSPHRLTEPEELPPPLQDIQDCAIFLSLYTGNSLKPYSDRGNKLLNEYCARRFPTSAPRARSNELLHKILLSGRQLLCHGGHPYSIKTLGNLAEAAIALEPTYRVNQMLDLYTSLPSFRAEVGDPVQS